MLEREFENVVPVFYAADKNYLPYLSVAIASLKANASKEREYRIHVLCAGELGEGAKRIEGMQAENIRVRFHDVGEKIERIADSLYCRDYYTPAIFYRLFIPELFPQYDKAVYLDCDTVLCADIAELYDKELKDNYLGAVADQAVAGEKAFRKYTKKALGISPKKYFNSGVITLNLRLLRESGFCQRFCELLCSYPFTVAPDQDCLNLLCKERVLYYPRVWNAMPCGGERKKKPKLAHYNLALKPFYYDGVLYEEYFWEYAAQTPFYEQIRARKSAFTLEQANRDRASGEKLIALARAEAKSKNNYLKTAIKNRKNKQNEVGRYGFIEDFARTLGGAEKDRGV